MTGNEISQKLQILIFVYYENHPIPEEEAEKELDSIFHEIQQVFRVSGVNLNFRPTSSLSYPLPRSMRWTPPARAMRLRGPAMWRFWNINHQSKSPHTRLPRQPTLSPAMAPNLPIQPDAKLNFSYGGWS